MTMRLNGFTRQELLALQVKAQRAAKGLMKEWAGVFGQQCDRVVQRMAEDPRRSRYLGGLPRMLDRLRRLGPGHPMGDERRAVRLLVHRRHGG